ncbi:MAG: hypothetical protein DRQ37_08190 [Gammaproteobacteria bacterium]|nr:MAG: hypothetical protein DRQ37_08190 [Gammaproteobacteria bacterium]
MKIKIDVNLTPEEARAFFGLPDVGPLQEEMLAKIQEKMLAGVEGYDPLSVMQPFLPKNLQTMEAMQKAFWQAATGADTGKKKT